jgi:sec-independent protein translocase protein TatA
MSSGEILLILCVYLLLFGAKGVPALAQTLGKAVYQFRNASQEVQNEIMKSTQEIRKQAEVRLDQLDTEPVQSSPPPQRPQPPVVTNPTEETPSDQKI